ncbi:Extracellular superoxide dismutase [Cu-Zn] [Schistosoma japonicum]|uniref:Extracellular superoxide dismutase [Cu-Zn] n=1 Tax=Schistosoma japonicum TaxID=6182 RepID=A0A4Z2DTT3_SCHJA|nr:Extracellular superoxide dismutase [Cu-Zn] [Schistosoma japonicum]
MLLYIFFMLFITNVNGSGLMHQCFKHTYSIATFNVPPYFGTVYFTKYGLHLNVSGSVTGLPKGTKLGVHVHEYGALGNECNDAGPHFNPFNSDHGGLTGSPRHPGDFGNLYVDHNGVMTFQLSVDISEIIRFDGFLGRALVIHEKEDDLGKTNNDGSRKTGNSGKRLTCAVIGIWRA